MKAIIALTIMLASFVAHSSVIPVYYCDGTITSTDNIKEVESVSFDTTVNSDFGFDRVKVKGNTLQYVLDQTGENFGMRLVLDKKTLKGTVSYTINGVVLDQGEVICSLEPKNN